jgi:hypothetical protein
VWKGQVAVVPVGSANTPNAADVLCFASQDKIVFSDILREPEDLARYAGRCSRSGRIPAKEPVAYLVPRGGLADNILKIANPVAITH